MTPSAVIAFMIQPHLFLKIVVDKTLKRVQGDDPLRRFQVSFDSARNEETTEIKHYLILVNKKAPFPHLRIGASLVKRLGLIRL